MANKVLFFLFGLVLSIQCGAQTYYDQQRQYQSYQAQHQATVRAYSVPTRSYSSPVYRSPSPSYSSSGNSNYRTSNTYKAPTRNTTTTNRRSSTTTNYNDYYDDDYIRMAKEVPLPVYTGSSKASCQGSCEESLTSRDKKVTYKGNTTNGLPDGQGVMTWASVATYTGSFVNGDPHGQGKTEWFDGASYVGGYSKGILEGQGVMTYADSTSVTATFSKGLPVKGKINYAGGNVYEGPFVNGLAEGKGTLTFVSGNKYTGDFKKGEYEGQGVLKLENSTFTGEFRKDRPYYGTLLYIKGGEFNGFFHESGETYSPKVGEHHDPTYTYQGWFDQSGKRSGYGLFTYDDGALLEGKWLNGAINGVGRYTGPDKVTVAGRVEYKGASIYGLVSYEGKWYNGLMKGGKVEYLTAENNDECEAAYNEVAAYLEEGRKKYNEVMSPMVKGN